MTTSRLEHHRRHYHHINNNNQTIYCKLIITLQKNNNSNTTRKEYKNKKNWYKNKLNLHKRDSQDFVRFRFYSIKTFKYYVMSLTNCLFYCLFSDFTALHSFSFSSSSLPWPPVIVRIYCNVLATQSRHDIICLHRTWTNWEFQASKCNKWQHVLNVVSTRTHRHSHTRAALTTFRLYCNIRRNLHGSSKKRLSEEQKRKYLSSSTKSPTFV